MKKVYFFVFFIIATVAVAVAHAEPAVAAGNHCRLLVNPVDRNRPIDWSAELVVVIDDEQVVTMRVAGGGQDSCTLSRGVAVVVDRDTRVARWVLICGNDILSPADWRPRGRVIAHEDRLPVILEEQMKLLQNIEMRLGVVEQKLDDLAARPAVTALDVERAVKRAMAEQKPSPPVPPPTPPTKSWFSRHWWVAPVAVILVSVAATSGGGDKNKGGYPRGGPTIP